MRVLTCTRPSSTCCTSFVPCGPEQAAVHETTMLALLKAAEAERGLVRVCGAVYNSVQCYLQPLGSGGPQVSELIFQQCQISSGQS